MGHFGRPAITRAWLLLVFPACILSYLGQGALILDDPGAISAPFFRLMPHGGLVPLVILATAATVIASQAVISGAFSLAHQACAARLPPAPARGPHLRARVRAGLRAGHQLAPDGGGAGAGRSPSRAPPSSRSPTGWRSPARSRSRRSCSSSSSVAAGSGRSGSRSCGAAAFLAVELAFFGANLTKFTHGAWVPLADRADPVHRHDHLVPRARAGHGRALPGRGPAAGLRRRPPERWTRRCTEPRARACS